MYSPQYPNPDQLNTAQKEDGDDQSGEAWSINAGENSVEHDHQGIDQAEQRHQNPITLHTFSGSTEKEKMPSRA